MRMTFSVSVLGASGYAGGELVRLLDEHPAFEVSLLGAHSQAGRPLREVHPHLSGGDRVLEEHDLERVAETDLAFLALTARGVCRDRICARRSGSAGGRPRI